jgi:predicted phosphoribosyltransferase
MGLDPTFHDRRDAALQLIPLLRRFVGDDVVVMAVPRGAVPMGKVIADHYGWPLSVVLVKKIPHPMSPEYAIGATGLEDVYLEPGHEDVSSDDIHTEVTEAQRILHARQRAWFHDRTPVRIEGKTVLVVDDGIATGATMTATIAILRRHHPSRIVIVTPVAAPDALKRLSTAADDVIVLHTSPTFHAVGQYYQDFSQVTDDEVAALLRGQVGE